MRRAFLAALTALVLISCRLAPRILCPAALRRRLRPRHLVTTPRLGRFRLRRSSPSWRSSTPPGSACTRTTPATSAHDRLPRRRALRLRLDLQGTRVRRTPGPGQEPGQTDPVLRGGPGRQLADHREARPYRDDAAATVRRRDPLQRQRGSQPDPDRARRTERLPGRAPEAGRHRDAVGPRRAGAERRQARRPSRHHHPPGSRHHPSTVDATVPGAARASDNAAGRLAAKPTPPAAS